MPTLDIAIIGAGASGTYCAYRLARETGASVEIFEAEDRIGGRLWSHRWEAADALVELGGEAFSPIHYAVFTLAQRQLGLDVRPHAPFNALRRLFLRNRLSVPADLGARDAFPEDGAPCEAPRLRYFMDPAYYVPASDAPAEPADPQPIAGPFERVADHLLSKLSPEVGEAFSALLEATAEKAAAGPLTAETAAGFIDAALQGRITALMRAVEQAEVSLAPLAAKTLGVDRVPARDLGFWDIVEGDLGAEAYELFLNAGYDNTSALQLNLVELTQNLLLGALMGLAQPNFWTLEGGFDQLPKALAAQSGAPCRLGRRLTRLRRDARADEIELTFALADGGEEVRRAKRVILTAPLACLGREIALEGFDAGRLAAFRQAREAIAGVPAGKLFLVYPQPWWTEMPDLPPGEDALHGYAGTDLPLRALYYRGLCGDGERGLMTGALADGVSQDFWSGFLDPDAPAFPGAAAADRRRFGAPVHMVDSCQRQLARMHETALPRPIPDPEAALYHEWRDHGGGWSAWKIGRDIHAEARLLRRPFAGPDGDEGLAICGDSVAERHGWVEESLLSAEAMLREAHGLGPAPWLPGKDLP